MGHGRHGRAVVLDDASPLDGPHVDVAVRIGWLLRMARLVTIDAPMPLEKLAERWLTSDQPDTRDRALRLARAAGRLVLPALAEDPTLAADVRGGARWWLRAGSRVVH